MDFKSVVITVIIAMIVAAILCIVGIADSVNNATSESDISLDNEVDTGSIYVPLPHVIYVPTIPN